ncbi:MAG: SRPBCC domain-containing protein, partial [Alphaproteobacteria bacterium]|nr:SRPBCC domain-containing protein [Alphaproteobacteria bacterium]
RHIFEAVYWDIVPGERIVFSYDMHLDARRISVSLSTIEFFAEAGGTRMRFTEQGVFLDGYDDVAGREEGTRIGLDNLERVLREGLDRGELDQTETDRRRAAS